MAQAVGKPPSHTRKQPKYLRDMGENRNKQQRGADKLHQRTPVLLPDEGWHGIGQRHQYNKAYGDQWRRDIAFTFARVCRSVLRF